MHDIGPCPSCGAPGKLIHPMGFWVSREVGYGPDGSRVTCTAPASVCCMNTPAFYGDDQDAEAVAAWNRRPAHPELETVDAAHERIISAALRLRLNCPGTPNGEQIISAPPPARHHTLLHPVNHALRQQGIERPRRVQPDDQGFLTSTGRFVGREEALKIALESGQPMIDHSSRHKTKLYSEDLW